MNREEEQELIEEFYRQAVSWAPTDEEELAIAQDLLEKAQRGFVVNDDGARLVYASDPRLPADAEFLVDEAALRQQRLRRLVPLLGAFLVAFVAIVLVYGTDLASPTPTPTATVRVAALLPTQTLTPFPTPTESPTPTAEPSSTATATAAATPTHTPTSTPLPPEEIELKPRPVKLEDGAVVPVSLEIADRYLPIVPTGLRDGIWAYMTEPDGASWLAGSYVNVVLGLPFSDDNLNLLSNTLSISDTLTLRNNVGGTNHYRVVGQQQVDVYAIEVLRQRQAGLTLVLLGGNDGVSDDGPEQRLIIQAVPLQAGKEVIPTED